MSDRSNSGTISLASVVITLAICAVVGAMFGWPFAWLLATAGGGGYASLLDSDVLFVLGMSVCLGLLVGAMICGVRTVVGTCRTGATHPPDKGVDPSN